ncbi:hypothetical protein CQA09_28500, partial [Klebsiella pneumoniae]
VYARIEGRQRIERAEHEMAVVHHAVRMAVGLGLELVIHLRLVAFALGLGRAALVPGGEGGLCPHRRPPAD